jgi:ATP-dependent DNA helicase RecG
MKNNNSSKPIFDTDKHSTYFLTTLPAFISDQVSAVVNATVHSRVSDILNLFLTAKKRTELFEMLGISNHSNNRKKYLDPY